MLRVARGGVNARRIRKCRPFAAAPLAGSKRCLCKRWTGSKIRQGQAAPPTMQAQLAQTCCGCEQRDSAIHLESRGLEKRRLGVALERFPQTRIAALPSFSNGAVQERRSPRKIFVRGRAAPMHRPAGLLRSSFDFAERFQPQTHGCIQGLSRASRAFAILPSPRLDPRQFPERARPIPFRTRAMEATASASRFARGTSRKTSSRTDSQKHVPSSARETLPQVLELEASPGIAE